MPACVIAEVTATARPSRTWSSSRGPDAVRVLAGLLVLAAVAGGCAPNLTPQQEWVMTNFESCRNETGGWNARLDRVEPDGRFYVTVAQTQTDYNRVVECMRARQEQEAAGAKSTRP